MGAFQRLLANGIQEGLYQIQLELCHYQVLLLTHSLWLKIVMMMTMQGDYGVTVVSQAMET